MMGAPWSRSHFLVLMTALALTCVTVRCAKDKPDRKSKPRPKPNILFILLDDAGMADFQSTDSKMKTPNIERIRKEGLFLNQSYMHLSCSPSRAALLSGRYPHTWGASIPDMFGLSSELFPNKKILYMGDVMRKYGYATHALGKWHQGHCHPSLRPLGRGFDTFYGMMAGAHKSYYKHSKSSKGNYDWWNNTNVDWSAQGKYTTELLNDRVVQIIQDSSDQKPFFVYLAYQAKHKPWEVPDKYLGVCKNITDDIRRLNCEMMYVVDLGVGQFIEALKKKGIYDNTAIIIMSDNGGPGSGSYNYPLRGGKGCVYEGGVNVYTVLKAPQLKVTGDTWPWMIYGVDWIPTLLGMAGEKKEKWMHGFNLWPDIKKFRNSRRTELLLHYDDRPDPKKFKKAYRRGSWKIIQGFPGIKPLWSAPSYMEMENRTLRKQKFGPEDFQLFDLSKDPYETEDLSTTETEKLEELKTKMEKFLKRYKLQPYIPVTKKSAKKAQNSYLKGCFCHPPWAEGTPDCPKPSS